MSLVLPVSVYFFSFFFILRTVWLLLNMIPQLVFPGCPQTYHASCCDHNWLHNFALQEGSAGLTQFQEGTHHNVFKNVIWYSAWFAGFCPTTLWNLTMLMPWREIREDISALWDITNAHPGTHFLKKMQHKKIQRMDFRLLLDCCQTRGTHWP